MDATREQMSSGFFTGTRAGPAEPAGPAGPARTAGPTQRSGPLVTLGPFVSDGLTGLRRCLTLWGLSFRALLLSLWLAMACPVVVGVGSILLPCPLRAVRRLADRYRALAARWSDIEIPSMYEEPLDGAESGAKSGKAGAEAGYTPLRARMMIKSSQERRDWRWVTCVPLVNGPLSFFPLSLVASAVLGVGLAFGGVPLSRELDAIWYLFVPVDGPVTAALAGLLGLAQLPLALWAAPRVVRAHAQLDRKLLAPNESALLADRIDHLQTTRSDAVDSQMAEIRRIERDLHDGAQARLVAMGMTLDAAEHLLESNTEAVRTLLIEARQSSVKALEELRDLVRGIHPPVLADRGLGDAVRSLAMLSPLRTEVRVELPGRPEPPVESAAYFAVSEVLANAAKHSGAERAWIEVRHEHGMLRVDITDEGCGGAEVSRGTGLRGIERRLATFDGVLAVNSPAGGPTMVTMELPCELSSRKTTSS